MNRRASLFGQGRLPGLHRVAMWLALAMLAFQAFAVQTHVHPIGPLAPLQVQSGGHVRVQSDPQHAQAPCALCEEMALFGHYMPPAPATLLLAPILHFWFQPARPAIVAARVTSHRWRSRAPPITLQA
jgi:hypothetical protein